MTDRYSALEELKHFREMMDKKDYINPFPTKDDLLGFVATPSKGNIRNTSRTTFKSGGQKDIGDKPRFDLIPPEAMKALAEVYSLGCIKYSDRNWEKGIPFSVCLGALKRHLNEFELGNLTNWKDGTLEHVAHAMWWTVALITFIRRGRTDLNDLPSYTNANDV